MPLCAKLGNLFGPKIAGNVLRDLQQIAANTLDPDDASIKGKNWEAVEKAHVTTWMAGLSKFSSCGHVLLGKQ